MISARSISLPHGITLDGRVCGDPARPVLLFLHGFPEGAFIWDAQLAHFSQPEHGGYYCVAPYLRGFGASSSPLDAEKRAGTFVCAACNLPLFDAAHKYDSRTGWPSFWQPLDAAVATKTDFKMIYPRTEYHCVRCGGHQGHVFNDGPKPTGQRYCNNGVALAFVPQGQALPALRD